MQPSSKSRLQQMTRCALCAAMLAVCAWVTVPSAVPFTMQSFGVFLSLLLFGGKTTAVAVTVYLLLGAVGLPVFAGMQGGIGVLFGTHGGFLIGFLLMALMDWAIGRCFPARSMKQQVGCIAAALSVCYLTGTAWYMLLTEPAAPWTALTVCVLPFVLPDALKLCMAAVISRPLQRRLQQ